MLWALKRTVSKETVLLSPKTYVKKLMTIYAKSFCLTGPMSTVSPADFFIKINFFGKKIISGMHLESQTVCLAGFGSKLFENVKNRRHLS